MKYVAVVGSRGFRSFSTLKEKLDRLLSNIDEPITIVSGGANGADTLARLYAQEKGYEVIEYLPDWDTHGKAAGFIRNKDIVGKADFLVAFWDMESKGTLSSINLAEKRGIPVRVIDYKKYLNCK